jgi:hypothetical protein
MRKNAIEDRLKNLRKEKILEIEKQFNERIKEGEGLKIKFKKYPSDSDKEIKEGVIVGFSGTNSLEVRYSDEEGSGENTCWIVDDRQIIEVSKMTENEV